MNHQPMRRQLGVKFLDQRLEPLFLQGAAKCGDPAFEKFLVAEQWPIGRFISRTVSVRAGCCHAVVMSGY